MPSDIPVAMIDRAHLMPLLAAASVLHGWFGAQAAESPQGAADLLAEMRAADLLTVHSEEQAITFTLADSFIHSIVAVSGLLQPELMVVAAPTDAPQAALEGAS